MKHLHVIALLFGALMVACNRPVETRHGTSLPSAALPQLQAIDSLMWRQPDSAFAQLRQFVASPQADSLDEFNVHYCQLLISELLYKNDWGQSNREELLQAVAYFDSIMQVPEPVEGPSFERNVFLAARAHYINGVGYYEQDSIVQACAEYLKTLEVMEAHFEERELVKKKAIFMTYTYNRLMELFSTQFMLDPAVECGEKALMFCRIEPTSSEGVSNILYRLGKQYDKMHEIDKARQYYELALENISNTDNMVYRDIVSSKALCDYETGVAAEVSVDKITRVLLQAETDNERLNRYLTIGGIYFSEGNYDSALYYLEPVFENHEAGWQDQAANYLYIVYDKLGNKERSDSLVHHLTSRKESVGDNKALVSRLEDLYKNHSNQKLKRQAEVEREKSVKRVKSIIIPTAGVVLLVVVCALMLRNKKQLKEQQAEAKKLLEEKDKQHAEVLEAERQTHQMQQAALSGRLKRSNEELRELRDLKRQQTGNGVPKQETQVVSFDEEPICRLIMERVNEGQFKSKVNYINYKDFALSKSHLLDLRLAADLHFNQFTRRLKTAYPKITNTDLDYCCLYLLGLTDSDVAALMQRSYNTVIERNGKMRKIFGSTSALPTTLMEIANDSHQFD